MCFTLAENVFNPLPHMSRRPVHIWTCPCEWIPPAEWVHHPGIPNVKGVANVTTRLSAPVLPLWDGGFYVGTDAGEEEGDELVYYLRSADGRCFGVTGPMPPTAIQWKQPDRSRSRSRGAR